MPPLTDPTRLAAYRDALGNWAVRGYVEFELTEEAMRWVERELSNVKVRDIARLMFEHVAAGGEIDEVKETRAEWLDHEFHYDLRLTIQGMSTYIETRLNFREPFEVDEASILVVNIHAP